MKQRSPQSIVDLITPDGSPTPWEGFAGSVSEALPVIDSFAAGKRLAWAPLTAAPVSTDDPDAPQQAIAQHVLRIQSGISAEEMHRRIQTAEDHSQGKDKYLKAVFELVERVMHVDIYSRRAGHQDDSIVDVRGFYDGLDRYSLLDAFEPPVSVSHLRSGVSYEYAPITLVASRCAGGPVAVTVIKRMSTARNRFLYLRSLNGGFPLVSNISEETFPVGTFIRHLGYAAPFYNAFKENSVQGALDRILPGMPYPVATLYHDWGAAAPKTQRRLAMGLMQKLAWETAANKVSCSITSRDLDGTKCQVGRYEFIVPRDEKPTNDLVRNFVHPRQPVLFICDGQTVTTAPRSKMTPTPTVITIDVSSFNSVKLDRLRSDPAWRDELVRAVLNYQAPAESPIPLDDLLALLDDGDFDDVAPPRRLVGL